MLQMLSMWKKKSRQEIISVLVADRPTDPHGITSEEQQDMLSRSFGETGVKRQIA